MKRLICFSVFLLITISQAQQSIKPKFVERLPDSIEINTARWVVDSVEYVGDPQCAHVWVNGEILWHKEREITGVDSLKLSLLPPRHIQPRICSKCLRKEYIVEEIIKQKIESEYARLRRQMPLKKR